MGMDFLRESIKPGTPQAIIRHLIFTDSYHYGHLSHEKTVEKYRGTVSGEYLDFGKTEELREAKKLADKKEACIRELCRNTPVTMDHVLRELCGDELLKKLRGML